MARITVEDCIDKFSSRFELVLVASNRARKLHSGEEPTVEKDNDKNSVIALREIAEGAITPEEFKTSLIEEYQTVTLNDEEEDLSRESSNSNTSQEESLSLENKNNLESAESKNQSSDNVFSDIGNYQDIENSENQELENNIPQDSNPQKNAENDSQDTSTLDENKISNLEDENKTLE